LNPFACTNMSFSKLNCRGWWTRHVLHCCKPSASVVGSTLAFIMWLSNTHPKGMGSPWSPILHSVGPCVQCRVWTGKLWKMLCIFGMKWTSCLLSV